MKKEDIQERDRETAELLKILQKLPLLEKTAILSTANGMAMAYMMKEKSA